MRETIGAVVRKPVFRIKLIAISLLFVVSLIEQVSNNYIQSSGQQVGRMTVILLLMHTFSYFSFYLSVFFVGYILLIPDIVKDAFIERQTMMRCQSRMRAAKYAIAKIIAFSILYVIWFVMLTILVGGIWFHDFSLAWYLNLWISSKDSLQPMDYLQLHGLIYRLEQANIQHCLWQD